MGQRRLACRPCLATKTDSPALTRNEFNPLALLRNERGEDSLH